VAVGVAVGGVGGVAVGVAVGVGVGVGVPTGASPSMFTLNRLSTGPIGFAMVTDGLPANSSPTGLRPGLVTISAILYLDLAMSLRRFPLHGSMERVLISLEPPVAWPNKMNVSAGVT